MSKTKKNKKLLVKKLGKEKILYCPDCSWEQTDWEIEHPSLHRDVKSDVKRAEEYCERHLYVYNHESCKPVWCDTCGYLLIYSVIIGDKK